MKAYRDKLEDQEKSDDTSSIGEPSEKKKSDDTSDDTSSIGEPSDDDEEDEMAESSKSNGDVLASLEALERALPIKRGLSNSFDGRSRSFRCLTNILNATAEDLVKHENPLNKRRKLLNIHRRGSYAAALSPPPPSHPPTTINGEGEQQQQPQQPQQG
ncbi:hypothetical protein J5N97_026746 [Dioscorea zingiberensis]|uniref:Uncharacterized protein n=1 Tax=Dioscorea zingiberensis TaxID=325984 RepID=A0A9D5C3P8_9LILI|nr:hypothetical protein J5N97_026746 [Dioscorea zingiberensis]